MCVDTSPSAHPLIIHIILWQPPLSCRRTTINRQYTALGPSLMHLLIVSGSEPADIRSCSHKKLWIYHHFVCHELQVNDCASSDEHLVFWRLQSVFLSPFMQSRHNFCGMNVNGSYADLKINWNRNLRYRKFHAPNTSQTEDQCRRCSDKMDPNKKKKRNACTRRCLLMELRWPWAPFHLPVSGYCWPPCPAPAPHSATSTLGCWRE